jgi:hypothetical protein
MYKNSATIPIKSKGINIHPIAVRISWLCVGLSMLYKVIIPPAAASNTTIKNLMISVCNLISSLVPSVVTVFHIRSGKSK